MNIRVGALVALLIAALVTIAATAGVAAVTALDPAPKSAHAILPLAEPAPALPRAAFTERGAVLGGTPETTASPQATPSADPPTEVPPQSEVAGIGSNYPGTAGWIGQATVALPGALGGRYTGAVNGHITVCADRCARLPVVDWCQCHWGTGDQRVVDLSHPAWALVSDRPLDVGLIEVRVLVEG